ncbi:Transcriptional activator hacA [Penicillium digitatum PHI26]|uniref:Transcriptional activator hacA n=3 Tax=Penicillium digitatum TaxID=36651 RepID=K9FP24_PEND2|nr:Transcriptional activator hacA [Penicillium digitatum Pd1]EKV08490.1 Transcriptional activator hacA [Penicillium digitatum Pd1]EKV10142.1 Transcriptional activator hacA [Penicillium digitatum PHI26]
MADTINPLDTLPTSPSPEMYTVSPADTSLDSPEPEDDLKKEDEEKKPTKKRKSWGQELPTPKTNLPPRKRAKTDDEKEQRRIERVLRNRAAAQTSRERKRLEMEKLETEKIRMEQQNQFLIQRLSQMETENNRLSQQVAKLSAEVRGSRSVTPKASSPAIESPTLTPTLFKQEGDELPMERIPFPTPSVTDYSPTLKPSTLAEASDVTQHPAAVLCDLQSPLSDDDFRRLFHGDSPAEPNPAFPEDGFAFDVLDGGDLSAFPFDSMVDFDPESVVLEGVQPSDLSDETSHQTISLQPSLGASTSRCDGQSIAASVTLPRPPKSISLPQNLQTSSSTFFLADIMVRKDPIFEARTNVKLHSNRLKKEAVRAEATFKSEKAKADKAMKNREFQIARIHAASAVREKRRQVTLKSEAARADVIINELKAAQSTRDTSRTLAMASRGLDAASRSVNLEHLVSHANNFLARSEDFKIASSAIEDVAQSISMQEYGAEGEADVDRLMEQLADDAGVDMRLNLEADAAPKEEVKEPRQVDAEVEDGLGARLRALRAAN